MANSNYNVNLSFTADVSAAKAQLNQLQTSLTDLSKSAIMSPTTKWTPEIQEAAQAALQLKHHLESQGQQFFLDKYILSHFPKNALYF